MRAFRAAAAPAARLAAALLIPLLASRCGENTAPPTIGDVTGLWTATMTGIPSAGAGSTQCTAGWVMSIQRGTVDTTMFTVIPYFTQLVCGRDSSDWRYRASIYLVRQEGATVSILRPTLDTFAVVTLSGSRMLGPVSPHVYPAATFTATRRSGPDPNLEPGRLMVLPTFPDLEIGDTMRFYAQVETGYGEVIDTLPVSWTSRAPAFAPVDAGGLVTGLSAGTTRIVASAAGLRDSQAVTVLVPAGGVQILAGPDSLIVGSGGEFAAVATDAGGQPLPDRRLVWQSSDTTIATIDDLARVMAVAPGTVTITARAGLVSAGATLRVLPRVAEVRVSAPTDTVVIGGTLQLTATTLDSAGNVITGRVLSWASDDNSIVAVDAAGLARGVAAGTVRVNATVEEEGVVGGFDVTAVMPPGP